jgi:hypothetical protein
VRHEHLPVWLKRRCTSYPGWFTGESGPAERNQEQGIRRVGDAKAVGQVLERATPDREAEEHEPAGQPQQCVALHQAAPAHELEDDEQDAGGGEDGNELNPVLHQIPCAAATGASSPASTAGRARNSPTAIASRTLIM